MPQVLRDSLEGASAPHVVGDLLDQRNVAEGTVCGCLRDVRRLPSLGPQPRLLSEVEPDLVVEIAFGLGAPPEPSPHVDLDQAGRMTRATAATI